jgi:hypothetical protein
MFYQSYFFVNEQISGHYTNILAVLCKRRLLRFWFRLWESFASGSKSGTGAEPYLAEQFFNKTNRINLAF